MDYVLITAARNEADVIRVTLDSVVVQSRLPERWVIVDDGSTDSTAAIVEEYAASIPMDATGSPSAAIDAELRRKGARVKRGTRAPGGRGRTFRASSAISTRTCPSNLTTWSSSSRASLGTRGSASPGRRLPRRAATTRLATASKAISTWPVRVSCSATNAFATSAATSPTRRGASTGSR